MKSILVGIPWDIPVEYGAFFVLVRDISHRIHHRLLRSWIVGTLLLDLKERDSSEERRVGAAVASSQ